VRRRDVDAGASPGADGTEGPALTGVEIVTLAVFLLGGDSQYTDTEDVAVKANELAPGKFSWVKYKNQINIHVIKTHLWDAKSERKGSLLLGSEREGWMLSASGLVFARAKVNSLRHLKAAQRKVSGPERRRMRTERDRMLKSDAYAKLSSGNADAVTLEEAETFFRLNAYIVGKARDRKVLRVTNTFGDDPELGPAVRSLAEKLRSR
jgi:hypothetical protein